MTNPKLAEMAKWIENPVFGIEMFQAAIENAYELGRADENEAIAKSQECGKPEEHKTRNCAGCIAAREIRSRLSGTGEGK